jgi:hypothetical protein
MNARIQCFLFVVIFSIATIVISTYASNQVNLVENGTVSLEFVPNKGIPVSKAYVYQDGGDLVILGKVKRSYGSANVTGHVDIEILDPDGITLKKTTATHVPRIVRRKGARETSFTVRLPIIPPKGASIRLSYHHFEE